LSYDRDSLIRLFNRVVSLKKGIGWVSKRKLDDALREWSREDRLHYSTLMESLNRLDNIERM